MIPVNEPLLDGNEKKYLNECIETGWISSEGPFVERFEKQLSKIVKREHGIAVCNGTAALGLAVAALDIGPGDEVILPTFTIISCVDAVIRAGATPILVDCELDSWNMSVEQVKEKITNRTKAILIVHIYGLPVDIDPILTLAKQFDLKIIEDAAEMLGQTYKGQPCGSFGDISTFSFYPNKLVTTGEGGMVVMNDRKLAEKCRSLMNLCFQNDNRFVHEDLGWNYRMSNLQSAVGLAQLEKLEKSVSMKRIIGKRYNKLLKNTINLQLPLSENEHTKNIYWVYGVVLNDDVPINAKEVMQLLYERGIGTRPFFWPMHKQPVLNKMGLFKSECYPNSEKISTSGFYLPSGLALTEEQQVTVSKGLIEILS